MLQHSDAPSTLRRFESAHQAGRTGADHQHVDKTWRQPYLSQPYLLQAYFWQQIWLEISEGTACVGAASAK
jgi:hypothetical protein